MKSKTIFFEEDGHNFKFVINYGITNANPGKQKDGFSITADTYHKGRMIAVGCQHDTILKLTGDEFKDMILFHLRHTDGEPIYPVIDGFYLARDCRGLADTWKEGEAAARNRLSEHLLVADPDKIERLLVQCFDKQGGEQFFSAYVDALRPQWKDAADAVIKKYDL